MARVLVCSRLALEKESSRTVDVGDLKLALFRNSDGEIYATQDSCTHELWSLGEEGDLDGNEVTCPLHLACFDVRTGVALSLPATEPLATYPVEVDEDDNVYVLIAD